MHVLRRILMHLVVRFLGFLSLHQRLSNRTCSKIIDYVLVPHQQFYFYSELERFSPYCRAVASQSPLFQNILHKTCSGQVFGINC